MGKRFALKSIDTRSRVLLVFIFTIALLLSGNLIKIQALEPEKYKELAVEQRIKRQSVQPLRGRILDREGKELAVNIELANVFINPRVAEKRKGVANKLAQLLKLPKSTVDKKLDSKKYFVYLAKNVTKEKVTQIKKADIKGLGFEPISKRHYPNRNLAPQLIGYTDSDNKGIAGLELLYDRRLGGVAGEMVAESDPMGRSIPGGRYVFTAPRNGKDLFLTLDADIQYFAQQALDKATEEYKANWGALILAETNTGNVLASAISPSPDLTKPREDLALFRNRIVSDLYEPGSVFKTLIMAAAAEMKQIKEGEKLYLPPTLKVGSKTIKEAHRSHSVVFSPEQILAQSSNIGTVLVAQRLGKENIYRFIADAGITSKTGTGFPGEASGNLPHPDDWSATSIANIPFGQGVAVTPAGLLASMLPIANNGRKTAIRYVHTRPGERTRSTRLISPEAAGIVLQMLRTAVIDGTGGRAEIEGYGTAGKTGTAQKVKTNGRGYESDKYVGSFMGFSPAVKPRLAMLVILDEPYPIWGGETAAPIYKDVMEFALRHLRIPPSGEQQVLKEENTKESEGMTREMGI